jgi:hypothetical protein
LHARQERRAQHASKSGLQGISTDVQEQRGCQNTILCCLPLRSKEPLHCYRFFLLPLVLSFLDPRKDDSLIQLDLMLHEEQTKEQEG